MSRPRVVQSDFSALVDCVASAPRKILPTIVFANAAFLPVLKNWAHFAAAAEVEGVVVAALDEQTAACSAQLGLSYARVPPAASRIDLWQLRVSAFAALAAARLAFIHSDADAVWLAAPHQHLPDGVDIAFSQGTIWPRDVCNDRGFVICAGFFASFGTARAAQFFQRVNDRFDHDGDDQIAINRQLLDDIIDWEPEGHSRWRLWEGVPFETLSGHRIGRSATLSAAVLPHSNFARLPERSLKTVVAHPLGKGDARRRLGRLALWR